MHFTLELLTFSVHETLVLHAFTLLKKKCIRVGKWNRNEKNVNSESKLMKYNSEVYIFGIIDDALIKAVAETFCKKKVCKFLFANFPWIPYVYTLCMYVYVYNMYVYIIYNICVYIYYVSSYIYVSVHFTTLMWLPLQTFD